MTDHELRRQLQEKFKFHELDLPANDWNAIEKRLPVAPRRIAVTWSWSVAVGVAAVALVAILLYQQPSNSLPTSPTFAESEQVSTESSNNDAVDCINTSTALLSQVAKTEKSTKENKKVDTKKEQKQSDKKTKSKRKTNDEDDNANDAKDTESIETAPKEDENQKPSLHEQEDDGSEYIVQLQESKQDNKAIAQVDKTETQNNPMLSIEAADALMREQNKQQMAALEESSTQAGTGIWNIGLLASITPEILTMSDVAPTVLMDNSFSYRSMNRVNAKHDLPIMVGASVGIPLAKGFSVHTGLNYAYIHSTITNENTLTGDYAVNNQKLHYLGIPVMFSYKVFDYNIVQCYVSGGGMAEKGLVKDVQTYTFDQTNALLDNNSKEEFINGFQFSLTANIGLGVRLYKGLNLFFEPGFTWYIPNNTSPQPESIRTEHPYNLSLTAGLRYNLNK